MEDLGVFHWEKNNFFPVAGANNLTHVTPKATAAASMDMLLLLIQLPISSPPYVSPSFPPTVHTERYVTKQEEAEIDEA